MHNHLNLIKTDFQKVEKRVLPRFPYCSLTFKQSDKEFGPTYEVKDISYTGMQLCLKDGLCPLKSGQKVQGQLHWKGRTLDVLGEIKWSKGQRVGVQFNQQMQSQLNLFLSLPNLLKAVKPIHQCQVDLEIPANLRYWISGDGPVELFVWQHPDGEVSRVQLIVLHNFIEWEDGQGPKTGRVLTLRDVDTPLVSEDEFVFQLDEEPDSERLLLACEFLSLLPASYMASSTLEFIQYKLRP